MFQVNQDDPFAEFDSLMNAGDKLPKEDREKLYGLVEFWFLNNSHNFVAYYRNIQDKKEETAA